MNFLSSPSPNLSKRFWLWFETITLPLLALAVGLFFSPQSLFAADEFPWLWLAPVLIALRYGVFAGLGASWLLVIGFFGLTKLGAIDQPLPKQEFLGGVLLVLLCGQFSDLWRKRFGKQQLALQYNEQRLAALTRDFYVTRLSHDILEQNLITQPATLRNAFEELRVLIAQEKASLTGEAAQNLMVLLSHYNRLETAGLFPVIDDRLLTHPSTAIGPLFDLNPADPLVTTALEKRTDAYYAVSQVISESVSDYLAVVPVESYNGKLFGLLVIQEMPFMALNEENLLMLKAILQYFADELSIFEESQPLRKHFPECPAAFGKELLKLSRLKQGIGVDSALVVLTLPPGPKQSKILQRLEQTKRGLDLHWHYRRAPNTIVLLKLMPLTATAGAEGFHHRFEAMMEEYFQSSPYQLGIKISYDLLPSQNLIPWLRQYVDQTPHYFKSKHLTSA